jgi:hypothetical protein
MRIFDLLTTFKNFVVGNQDYLHHGLLPIDGDTLIFRVEKRAIDCEYAHKWFGDNFHINRHWKLVTNSNEPLRTLLGKYRDTELYEFRVKPFNGVDK